MTVLGIHDYWLFVATGILLNLTPGQDTFYILGRSITQGHAPRRVGVRDNRRVVRPHRNGGVGLSALLATSAYAFTVVSSWVPRTSSI
jgi:threonine/homoserine/homoserine lactone efflux protein